jgi:hypothetical protein
MKLTVLKNLTELEGIERIDPEVSKQYVPIYTSDIVKALSDESNYVFDHGYQIGNSTKHSVVLKNTEDESIIKIYNSFDRSLALRIYYFTKDGGISYPVLNDYRVIHRGEKAKNMVDHINEIKEEVFKSIPRIVKLQNVLGGIKVDLESEAVKKINDILFSYKRNKLAKSYNTDPEKFEYVNYVDIIVNKQKEEGEVKMTLLGYFNSSIKNHLEGNYGVKYPDGTVKSGRKTTSALAKIELSHKVANMLMEEYPEYFL